MKQLIFVALLFVSSATFSQDKSTLRKKEFNLDNGVAISGYDPVSYFLKGKPVKGNKMFAVSANGVTYYFSSEADRELFNKNPSQYEPQYGGWCAYAMGKEGSKVEVDPETYKVINGKLYLFYNKLFHNTLPSWNKDEIRLHQQADLNWQKIYHH